METIRCPLEKYLDKELPVKMIFDTMQMKNDVAISVAKILIWIATHKDTKGEEIIRNILRANLGANRYDIIHKCYIDTYDEKSNILKRYFYLEDPNIIYDIMDSFNIIYSLIPVLSEVASYYK